MQRIRYELVRKDKDVCLFNDSISIATNEEMSVDNGFADYMCCALQEWFDGHLVVRVENRLTQTGFWSSDDTGEVVADVTKGI